MAEAIILVCDNDERAAEVTVRIELNGSRVEKDLCGRCYTALMKGTRKLKRGRKRVTA